MSDDNARNARTQRETAAFTKKLRTFADQLPEDQRRSFYGLIKGAAATLQLAERTRPTGGQGSSFAGAIRKFHDGLPPRERDAFAAILTASALAWGARAGGAGRGPRNGGGSPGGEPGVIYFWHFVHLARTVAVLVTGAVVVIQEATEDEDPSVPVIDIPSLEEPSPP